MAQVRDLWRAPEQEKGVNTGYSLAKLEAVMRLCQMKNVIQKNLFYHLNCCSEN